MLQEERSILWYTSALTLGLALPGIMLGNGIMYGLVALGVLSGLLATKDMSLRATVTMIRTSRFVLLFTCLLGVLVTSSLWGLSPEYSLHKTAEAAGVLCAALLLFITLREMPGKYVSKMHQSLVIGTLFIVAVIWIDSFSGSYRFSAALHGTQNALQQHRLNFHSIGVALLLPFLWAHYARRLREKDPLVKMSAPVILPLTFATVFLCGGRAGMAAAIASLAIFLFFGAKRFNFNLHAKHWVAACASIALGFLGYVISRGHGLSVLWERLEIAQSERGFGGGRGEIWETALRHMGDSPIIGIGPNAFRFLPEQVDFHPHNAVLQMALETGLVGVVLAGGITILLLSLFYRYARSNVFGLAVLASFCGYLTASLASKSVFDVEWMSLLAVLLLVGWRLGWSSGIKPAGQVLSASTTLMDDMKQAKEAADAE